MLYSYINEGVIIRHQLLWTISAYALVPAEWSLLHHQNEMQSKLLLNPLSLRQQRNQNQAVSRIVASHVTWPVFLVTKTPSFTPVATATVGLPAGAGFRLQWTARPREIGLSWNTAPMWLGWDTLHCTTRFSVWTGDTLTLLRQVTPWHLDSTQPYTDRTKGVWVMNSNTVRGSLIPITHPEKIKSCLSVTCLDLISVLQCYQAS